METLQYALRKLIYSIPLIFGVTMISFVLMVYFGPDITYSMLGKNATDQQIVELREQLGYNLPFIERYFMFLKELVTFDFGSSISSGEKVTSILGKHVPVSIAVALPSFILSNVFGVTLALIAAFHRGKAWDKLIMVFAVVGMSVSYLMVVIAFQVIFSTSYGFNWFPVQGWVEPPPDYPDITFFEIIYYYWYYYWAYVAVPTMASVFVSLGYNTRFFRAVIVEELNRDYVRTAKAYGVYSWKIMVKHVLKNALIPISTRIIITLPFVIIAGNLVLEKFFGIPGIGLVTYDAITNGDLPIVKAVVTCTAVLYVMALIFTDIVYKMIDPRISYNR
ncbi:MAG: ABC transporter permease [Opitutales bacterium]|nr:ABC transporter permease [Opitutales bacterium]